MSEKTTQNMKPATAAKKLGIYLPAAPAEFQEEPLSRAGFNELPHPRPVVAHKLNVSISGLARAEITDALTTAQIDELLADRPVWLQEERASLAAVRAEEKRVRDAAAAKGDRS